jgi:hypothetical protein
MGERAPRIAPAGHPTPLAVRPRRLPDPTQHARRQREAAAERAQPAAAELLYVEALVGAFAVLRRADGSVIDEEVAVAGDARPLRPGDRVVRVPIPGRGRRDAAGSYVALGPLNPARTAPALAAGPAMGTNPTAITVGGSDDYARISFTTGGAPVANAALLTLTWTHPLATSDYGFVVLARGSSSGALVGGGYWISSPSTAAASLAVVGPLAAATAYTIHLVRIVDPA